MPAEQRLGHASGHAHDIHDVGNVYAVAGVAAYELRGLRHTAVCQPEAAGGLASRDEDWPELERRLHKAPVVHASVEKFRAEISALLEVQPYRRQRGLGAFADNRVVVHADHGKLLGHGDSRRGRDDSEWLPEPYYALYVQRPVVAVALDDLYVPADFLRVAARTLNAVRADALVGIDEEQNRACH